jgi:hypothetical protein
MSSENKDSDSQDNGTSKVSIGFDTFKTFFKDNTDLDNAEYYQSFPSVNPGTIRSWKARARKEISEPEPQTPSTPMDQPSNNDETKRLKQELIKALMDKTKFQEELLEGLDEDSQLKLLKNASDNMPSDPNIRLMTPSGTGKAKLGIEQYLKIDEKSFKEKGFGDVELILPASVLHSPKKSEQLKEYK